MPSLWRISLRGYEKSCGSSYRRDDLTGKDDHVKRKNLKVLPEKEVSFKNECSPRNLRTTVYGGIIKRTSKSHETIPFR
jgi:hypothetical protein